MLSNIVPAEGQQTDFFGFKPSVSKSDKLMSVMDDINRKMGKQKLRFASQGYKQPWAIKQEMKSQGFTTKWDEILSSN